MCYGFTLTIRMASTIIIVITTKLRLVACDILRLCHTRSHAAETEYERRVLMPCTLQALSLSQTTSARTSMLLSAPDSATPLYAGLQYVPTSRDLMTPTNGTGRILRILTVFLTHFSSPAMATTNVEDAATAATETADLRSAIEATKRRVKEEQATKRVPWLRLGCCPGTRFRV